MQKDNKSFENIDGFWADFNSRAEYGAHKYEQFVEQVCNNEIADGTTAIYIDADESKDGKSYSFVFSLNTNEDTGIQSVSYISCDTN